MEIRKNSRPYKILKNLGIGTGVLIISTISPLAGSQIVKGLIKEYFRRKNFERYRFLNDLKNLQKRDLIDYQELDNNKIKIVLTKQGKEKMLMYQIDEMKLKKPPNWDKKWRLIMFDIPHQYKKARDVFRLKLKNLEFYPIQKSVFITPYPCENEIDFLASVFDIRRFILVLYVSRFEGEEKLKHHFKI